MHEDQPFDSRKARCGISVIVVTGLRKVTWAFSQLPRKVTGLFHEHTQTKLKYHARTDLAYNAAALSPGSTLGDRAANGPRADGSARNVPLSGPGIDALAPHN
jgi:hypothetical protein